MDWSSFLVGALSMCVASVGFILFCMRFAKLHPPERVPAEIEDTELASNIIYAPPEYFSLNPRGKRS
jgi:hypothetical protein